MCKRRKDGTLKYCPSRQPGARSRSKAARRKAIAISTRKHLRHLPDPGSVREMSRHVDALAQCGRGWAQSLPRDQMHEVLNYTRGTDQALNRYLTTHGGVLEEDAQNISVPHDEYGDDHQRVGKGAYSRSMRESVLTLDAALENAPRLSEPTVVYRGVEAWGESQSPREWAESMFAVDSNVVLPSYSSTSADPVVAVSFGGIRPVIFEIVSTQGSYVDTFSHFGGEADLDNGEKEIILPRNSRFKVVGIDEGRIAMEFPDGESEVSEDTYTFVRMVEVRD